MTNPSIKSRLTSLWPVAMLALLVALVYWPGRGGGYVFDDYPNIVDNAALHVTTLDWHAWVAAVFSSDSGTLLRPLAMLTFAINHYFTGLDPVPMKLTNIAIHALNACLVLGLLRTLLALALPDITPRRREWASRFTAATWALHPINLMAVLFVVQRMESLSHTFVFAGLWLYLSGRQQQINASHHKDTVRPARSAAGAKSKGKTAGDSAATISQDFEIRSTKNAGWWRIIVGLIGGTALGALCKESAVLLPLYAACIELCVLGFRNAAGHRDRRLLIGYLLLLVIPALIAVAWLLPASLSPGAYATRDFSLGERLLTEGRVVLDYLRWTLFPSLRELSLYHDDFSISRSLLMPWSTLPALLGIAVLLALVVWSRRRRPLMALGIAWFLAAQLLTATFIPLELVYEHRNYFASLGICLAVADLLLLAPPVSTMRRIGVVLASLWLAMLALTTNLRAREWSDPLRFAASEAAKHPQSPRATYAHARLMMLATDFQKESPLYGPAQTALEKARAAPNSGILPHSALIRLAASTGRPQKEIWWDEMLTRLDNGPIGPQEIGAIATLAHCTRDGRCPIPPERMLAVFQTALRHGQNPEVLNIYADYVFNVMEQPGVAIYLWRKAMAQKPKDAQYRVNLIKVLIALGRRNEALEQIALLRQAGRFDQNDSAAAAMMSRLDRSQRAPKQPADN